MASRFSGLAEYQPTYPRITEWDVYDDVPLDPSYVPPVGLRKEVTA